MLRRSKLVFTFVLKSDLHANRCTFKFEIEFSFFIPKIFKRGQSQGTLSVGGKAQYN
jgi:hypothetical protein